jgi:hypothetical protein
VISQAAVTRLASLKRGPINADSLGKNRVFRKSADVKKVSKWVVSKEKRALLCDNARFLAPLGSPVEKKLSRICLEVVLFREFTGSGQRESNPNRNGVNERQAYL